MTTPLVEASPSVATRRPFPMWLVAFFVTLNAGLLLLVVWVFLRFDSVENAVAFATGRTLSVREAEHSLGTIPPHSTRSVAFTIINPEATPVRIVGAATGCACTTADQAMPFTIPGGGRFVFRATYQAADGPMSIRVPITLFTDHPGQPKLELVLTGRIAAEPQHPAAKSS